MKARGLVLLIDDSPVQAAKIVGMLAAAGWDFCYLRDYADGYHCLPEVDAIVADFVTPSQTDGATYKLFAQKCGKPITLLSWTDCGGLPHLDKADLPGCLLDWLDANVPTK